MLYMKNFLICFITIALSFGLFISDASAKRFGGGRSFGNHRMHKSHYSSHQTKKATTQKQQKNNKNILGGLLGGLLIGGLLTSLLMGHGFASGIMSWLIMGSLIFFLVTMFRKKMNPSWQASNSRSGREKIFEQPISMGNHAKQSDWELKDYPTNFDEDDFLRSTKVTFNRLQAANDQRNLRDIQTFTTPEIFAEIKMQFDERGDAKDITEVSALHAKLLDISNEGSYFVAYVHFTGFIKENDDQESVLNEIWAFHQNHDSSQWLVAGIRQSGND